jgi:nucleotide-binding universal stress UspA family protein
MARREVAPRVEQKAQEALVSTTETQPILLCYDGSDGARHAIDTAAALFPGREAIVLHTWRPVGGIGAAYAIVPVAVYDEAELHRSALELAEEGAAIARAAGLDARAQIAEITMDAVWHTILDVADQDDAAVIVLGTRGLSALKTLVLGSVSHGVTVHAHRPVLVVPPAPHANAPAGTAATAATAG